VAGRAQANLLALAVALALVTAAVGIALTVAGGAFAAADREPLERQAAAALADRLLAAESPLTLPGRARLLDPDALGRLDGRTLRKTLAASVSSDAAARERGVRVTLDGQTVAAAGDPAGGTTVRRLVGVAARGPTRSLADGRAVLPPGTAAVRVVLNSSSTATVHTLRADGRVVLRDPSGLRGTYAVALPGAGNHTLELGADGNLSAGDARVVVFRWNGSGRVLGVTVDA
jgi:hypothetical protein